MIEFTVPLTLPLRAVVLAGEHSAPPPWVEEQFSRIPVTVAARRTASAKAAAAAQREREQEQVRQLREGWKHGLTELQSATERADAQCAEAIGDLREAAIELAHAIACKLVFQQLNAGTFPMDRLVSEVLGRLTTHEPATVRLHPEDLAVLQRDGDFVQSLDPERSVRLIADPKLSRVDCKAVGGEITVVYELHRQIEEIRRELLSTVTGHAESGP